MNSAGEHLTNRYFVARCIAGAFTLIALTALSASNSPTPVPAQLPHQLTIKPAASTTADVGKAARHAEIVTTEDIDASSQGLIGDGMTDNTAAFNNLMAHSNRRITIKAGTYLTGKFSIPENTILIFQPGVTIKDSGMLSVGDPLIKITGRNVRILGNGLKLVANRNDYTTGEYRHGIFIFGANNIYIEDVDSIGQGGDGFYIGGPREKPSQDISLINCKARNNRRQGLSITSARRVDVVDFVATETNGTPPQFGIDLEPNFDYDSLDDIRIIRPKTAFNKGGGLQIVTLKLTATSHPINIAIQSHISKGEPASIKPYIPKDTPGSVAYSQGGNFDFCKDDADCRDH